MTRKLEAQMDLLRRGFPQPHELTINYGTGLVTARIDGHKLTFEEGVPGQVLWWHCPRCAYEWPGPWCDAYDDFQAAVATQAQAWADGRVICGRCDVPSPTDPGSIGMVEWWQNALDTQPANEWAAKARGLSKGQADAVLSMLHRDRHSLAPQPAGPLPRGLAGLTMDQPYEFEGRLFALRDLRARVTPLLLYYHDTVVPFDVGRTPDVLPERARIYARNTAQTVGAALAEIVSAVADWAPLLDRGIVHLVPVNADDIETYADQRQCSTFDDADQATYQKYGAIDKAGHTWIRAIAEGRPGRKRQTYARLRAEWERLKFFPSDVLQAAMWAAELSTDSEVVARAARQVFIAAHQGMRRPQRTWVDKLRFVHWDDLSTDDILGLRTNQKCFDEWHNAFANYLGQLEELSNTTDLDQAARRAAQREFHARAEELTTECKRLQPGRSTLRGFLKGAWTFLVTESLEYGVKVGVPTSVEDVIVPAVISAGAAALEGARAAGQLRPRRALLRHYSLFLRPDHN